ncbi:MAG: site-2 protease family protein [Chitinispirillaceae bacterium]
MGSLEARILRIPVILLAITIHEFAHGYVARRCGDDTAERAGRLTFNPFSHLDIFGALMMFFGPFGWAKPVPVNPSNLRNQQRDIALVSAAGPASNIILAVVAGVVYRLISGAFGDQLHWYIPEFFRLLVFLNLGLSFFNLLPIPPLDGSKILMSFLPRQAIGRYMHFVRYAPTVFIGLIVAEWVLHIPLISLILNPLWQPYLGFWSFIIFGGSVI